MISIYTYLFNATVRDFDLDGAIANFTSFADEVVIATLAAQEDDTLFRLQRHEDALEGKLKVVVCNIDPLRNNRFDGDLKTEAMQLCTYPVRVIADCDERFVVSQRPLWDTAAQRLLDNPHQDGWLIPVVDLYGSPDFIRLNDPIGVKFRMHKATIVRRGVPAYAERGQGYLDTSQSDTTEPLRADGSLGTFLPLVQHHLCHPSLTGLLSAYPYVLHYGYIDLARRAKISREWWKPRWEERSGRSEQVPTDVFELRNVPVIKHSLTLP